MEPLNDVFLPEGKTYIVGLTVKSGETDPSLQIYFNSITEAIISMFHPSMQSFLASDKQTSSQGDVTLDDSIEIYLNVFFVREQVIVKRPQNMGANRENLQVQKLISESKTNIFRERDALRDAIQHDCHLEGTPSFLIDFPVHFDLTAIKTNYGRILHMMDARNETYRAMDRDLPHFLEIAKDIDGRLNGLVFCDLDLLIHTHSYILDMSALVDSLRRYMNDNYGLVGDSYNPALVSRKGYMTLGQIIAYVRSELTENMDLYLTNVSVKVAEPTSGLDIVGSITPRLSPKSPVRIIPTVRQIPTIGPFGDPNEAIFSKSGIAIDTFRGVPYDVLRLIGLNMDLESINRTCRTSKIFNSTFCSYGPNNENFARVELFWLEKVRKDFGEEEEMSNANAPEADSPEALIESPKMTWIDYYKYLAGPGLAGITNTIRRGLTTLQLYQLYCLLDNFYIVGDIAANGTVGLLPNRLVAIPERGRAQENLVANTGLADVLPVLYNMGGSIETIIRIYLQGRQANAAVMRPTLNILKFQGGNANFSNIKVANPFRAITQRGQQLEATRREIINLLRPYMEILKTRDFTIRVKPIDLLNIIKVLGAGTGLNYGLVKDNVSEDISRPIYTQSRVVPAGRGNQVAQIQIFDLIDRSKRLVRSIILKMFNMSNPDSEPELLVPINVHNYNNADIGQPLENPFGGQPLENPFGGQPQ